MQNTPEREIDLMRLLLALWHRIWIIVGCTLAGAVLALAITHHFITPMYQANVSIYVDNRSSAEQDNEVISSSNLSTAERLVKTYVTIIESDTVLGKVAELADLDLSAAQIRNMMSASSVNETEVFRIYITHADPNLAAHVANAVAEVAPAQISSFLSGSSTKIIDYAKVPTTPISPNAQRNTIMGAMIGAVLAIAAICLASIFDVRIKDEEELERLFEHPVLGSIPAFDANPKSNHHYSTYGYGETDKENEEGDA